MTKFLAIFVFAMFVTAGMAFSAEAAEHPIKLKTYDHIVLSVRDIQKTVDFYQKIGMRVELKGTRYELYFGEQKINLHAKPGEFQPSAYTPVPGSADFCIEADGQMDEIVKHVKASGIEIILGPTTKSGAKGPMTSIYMRDPDLNLVEISVYDLPKK